MECGLGAFQEYCVHTAPAGGASSPLPRPSASAGKRQCECRRGQERCL